MKKRIVVIIGTRPEATKMCVVVKELQKNSDVLDVKLVLTGQHKEQLEQVIDGYGLKADLNLNIMKESQTLSYVASTLIKELDIVYSDLKPDLVIVHGDTQSSYCGALVAFYHKISVAHVEAGLRSFNKYSPWPEEVNRMMIDTISDIHFAPTVRNKQALVDMGYNPDFIYVTGQSAVDATLDVAETHKKFDSLELQEIISAWDGRVVSMTAHRRENYGQPMINIFKAIRRLADENKDIIIVYPMHLSPEVRRVANLELSNHERIFLIEPVSYFDMVLLMSNSYMVLSDSGGLQEETSTLGVPMVLLRDTTERQEAIEAGTVVLSGTDEEVVFNLADELLNDKETYKKMTEAKNPFGDGMASKKIVSELINFIEKNEQNK